MKDSFLLLMTNAIYFGASIGGEVGIVEPQIDGVDALEIDGGHVVLETVEGEPNHVLDTSIVIVAGAIIQGEHAISLGGSGGKEYFLAFVFNESGSHHKLVVIALCNSQVAMLGRIDFAGHSLEKLFVKPGAIGSGDAIVNHIQLVNANEITSGLFVMVKGVGGVFAWVIASAFLLASGKSATKGDKRHSHDKKMFLHTIQYLTIKLFGALGATSGEDIATIHTKEFNMLHDAETELAFGLI